MIAFIAPVDSVAMRFVSRMVSRRDTLSLQLYFSTWRNIRNQRSKDQSRQTQLISQCLSSAVMRLKSVALWTLHLDTRMIGLVTSNRSMMSLTSCFRIWRSINIALKRLSGLATHHRIRFLQRRAFSAWCDFKRNRSTAVILLCKTLHCLRLRRTWKFLKVLQPAQRNLTLPILLNQLSTNRLASSFWRIRSFRRNFQLFRTLDRIYVAKKLCYFQHLQRFSLHAKLAEQKKKSKTIASKLMLHLLTRIIQSRLSVFKREIYRSTLIRVTEAAAILTRLSRTRSALRELQQFTLLEGLAEAQASALAAVSLVSALSKSQTRKKALAYSSLRQEVLHSDNVELASFLKRRVEPAATQTEEDTELAAYAEIVRKLEKSLLRAENEKQELRRRLDETRDNFRLLVSRSLDSCSVFTAGG